MDISTFLNRLEHQNTSKDLITFLTSNEITPSIIDIIENNEPVKNIIVDKILQLQVSAESFIAENGHFDINRYKQYIKFILSIKVEETVTNNLIVLAGRWQNEQHSKGVLTLPILSAAFFYSSGFGLLTTAIAFIASLNIAQSALAPLELEGYSTAEWLRPIAGDRIAKATQTAAQIIEVPARTLTRYVYGLTLFPPADKKILSDAVNDLLSFVGIPRH